MSAAKWAVLLIWISVLPAETHAGPNVLLPRPQQVRYGTGRLLLQNLGIRFASAPSAEDRFAANQLAAALSTRTGLPTSIWEGPTSGRAIVLERTGAIDALPLPDERPGPESREAYEFLARWKANQYYFYSEASIELEGYPLLNPGGKFTQDQVRRIIAYGRDRHVDVVPCLELYGHLHDLFRVERYSDLAAFSHGGEFNPKNPKVMELLSNWADQFVRLFPSPFVHIGFDETWQIEMAAKKEGSSASPARLFVQQLKNVAGLFQRQNRRVMSWADIIVKYPEIASDLPSGLIGVAWEYDAEDGYRKWLDPLLAKGVPHLIATAVSFWREVTPDFEHTFDNIDTFLVAGRQSKAMGAINTVWLDSSQNFVRQARPAIAYGAAAAWQTPPMDRSHFFQEYARLTADATTAADVAQGMEKLSRAELQLQKALGQQTMHAFWDDPFRADVLQKSSEHREDLRQTRLLAEDAQEHFSQALNLKADPALLNSFLVGSQMLDYAGLKFLTS